MQDIPLSPFCFDIMLSMGDCYPCDSLRVQLENEWRESLEGSCVCATKISNTENTQPPGR